MSTLLKQDLSYTYAWPPEGVPQNYDELYRDWGTYIGRKVANFNKVSRNFEDLFQHIWMKLMEPSKIDGRNFLQKFEYSAACRLPPALTAEEACDYLGVTWKQWTGVLSRGHSDEDKWAPTPLNGDPTFSKEAKFSTEQIRILDEINPFRSRPNVRVRPPMTARGFKAYLTQAIHNHFANWCRTRSRKYKELVLSPAAIVTTRPDSGDTTSHHVCRREFEDYSAWESNIVRMSLGDEGMLSVQNEIQKQFERRGVDPTSERGKGILDFIMASDSYASHELPTRLAKTQAINHVFKEAFKAQERAEARDLVRAGRQVLAPAAE